MNHWGMSSRGGEHWLTISLILPKKKPGLQWKKTAGFKNCYFHLHEKTLSGLFFKFFFFHLCFYPVKNQIAEGIPGTDLRPFQLGAPLGCTNGKGQTLGAPRWISIQGIVEMPLLESPGLIQELPNDEERHLGGVWGVFRASKNRRHPMRNAPWALPLFE